MTDTRILNFDPITGDRTELITDDSEDKAHIVTVANVDAVLEANKQAQNDGTGGWTPSKDMRHAARIPPAVVELWQVMYGIDFLNKDHAPAIKRLLNSSEWRHLRTANFNM